MKQGIKEVDWSKKRKEKSPNNFIMLHSSSASILTALGNRAVSQRRASLLFSFTVGRIMIILIQIFPTFEYFCLFSCLDYDNI
jgi:hypothetical protein